MKILIFIIKWMLLTFGRKKKTEKVIYVSIKEKDRLLGRE